MSRQIAAPIKGIKITGNEGDKKNNLSFYGEGAFVFKRNDLFYLLYSNSRRKKSTLVYATSKTPMGPFNFQGEVMDVVNSWTSHNSIVEFNDKCYLFYHNMNLSSNSCHRSICFDELTFDEAGKINKLKKNYYHL